MQLIASIAQQENNPLKTLQTTIKSVMLVISFIALTGCGSGSGGSNGDGDVITDPAPVSDSVPVTGVTLDRETLTMAVSDTYQLTATVTPGNASNKTLSWSTSADSVAAVNENGLVTGIAEGSATITVTTEDGAHTDSCTVTVTTDTVPVTGVTLNRETLTMAVSDTYQLTATVTPGNASNKTLSWSTSADSVAAVNENGLVTGIAEGSATITVTTQDGDHTDSCTVTVQSGTGYIVANHEAVEQYADIPQEYIDIVKTWLVDAAGESHSEGYRTGVDSTNGLGSIDSRFAATTFTWGLPAATDQALRLGTHATVGEGDFWTNDTARDTIKDLIRQQFEDDNPIHVIFQAWCGDLIRTTGPAGTGTDGYDPVYGCHWLGSSVGGPDGNHIWGLDSGDFEITGNRVSLQTYLDTIDEYNEYSRTNGYLTIAVFATGPVDGGSATGEAGYQRYVKHQRIREFVMESQTRILFDYADILAYNDENEQHLETWTSPYSGETCTFPAIHPDNDTEDTGHISYAGALRIGKAMWWLLARMAGWNGNTE
ncbi:MAG: Ig domain-containing protein [Chitinispirillaceae bacterium]|nr:Ig domain-containing protein [Chitinispirillaceae bacterium]MBN2771418.1 Ig domain-containing protein [Spirochaetota bacterium]